MLIHLISALTFYPQISLLHHSTWVKQSLGKEDLSKPPKLENTFLKKVNISEDIERFKWAVPPRSSKSKSSFVGVTNKRLDQYQEWNSRTHSTSHTPKSSPPIYTYDQNPSHGPMHFPKTPPRVAVVLPQDEHREMGRYRNPRGYSEWW
jgi:hypothetical protein